MKKLLVSLLIVVGNCLGQQGNTVYLSFIDQKQTSTVPALTQFEVNNNIGQTFHSFEVTLGDGVINTCASLSWAYQFSARIEASYNGKVYFTLPQTQVNISTDTDNFVDTKFYRTVGAYPYVRMLVTYSPNENFTGCPISVSYSGTLNANPLGDSRSAVINHILHVIPAVTCGPLIIINGNANSQVKISTVSLQVVPLNSPTGNINFYRDSACSQNIGALQSNININAYPPDSIFSPSWLANGFSWGADVSNKLGLWVNGLTGGDVYVTAGFVFNN